MAGPTRKFSKPGGKKARLIEDNIGQVLRAKYWSLKSAGFTEAQSWDLLLALVQGGGVLPRNDK